MSSSEETYAQTLYRLLGDKEVQLYIGDDTGTLNYADYDVSQKAMIEGKIRAAEGQILVVEVAIITNAGKTLIDTLYLHSWAVKGVMVKSDKGYSIMTLFGNAEYKRRRR